MERDKLKLIVRNLKLLVDALEYEVFSDKDAYVDHSQNFSSPPSSYDEIFNDDDGYPDWLALLRRTNENSGARSSSFVDEVWQWVITYWRT